MIRSTKHSLNFSNTNKLVIVQEFIQEYRRVASIYIDYIWEGNIEGFDAKTNLDIPKFLSTTDIEIDTFLSARSLKCCITQVCGMISAACEKARKRQYVVNQFRTNNQKVPKRLRRTIRLKRPIKPNASCINPELNSIVCEFESSDNHFDGFVKLSSFTNKERGISVKLPIKFTKRSNIWKQKGTMLNSFLLCPKHIEFRWEIKNKIKTSGKTVGCDQGKSTVITLSDGQVTPKEDNHGHSLTSIIDKLSRKKKGSKAFGQAQDHRKNFINWSINQLNFDGIKQVNFENIININFGKNVCRVMKHWTNTLIRDKFYRRAEEQEVLVKTDPSTYYSQRCSSCGLVRKSQRKNKTYLCKNCGLLIDADLNAATNHQLDLPDVSGLRNLKLNVIGFFWKLIGCFTLEGVELTVPLSKN